MAIISDFNDGEDQQQKLPEPQSSPSVDKPKSEEPPKPERLVPNKSNGLDMENYTWGQSLPEVNINITVPQGTKGRSIVCEIKKDRIKVGLKNSDPIIEGEFFGPVNSQECYWSLDGTDLSILLTKQDKSNWWKSLLKGGPEIDIQKVEPETSKLADLDGETRSVVEKMMFDQRQKQMGLPTSEDIQQQDMMKKLKEQFPDMDFSGSKAFGGRKN